MKPLCIYHGNCADGFTAAWAVYQKFGQYADYHAGVYQDPPPDVAGRDVVIVDFSYKRPVLEGMLRSGDVNQASTILILDHHKTAAADLSGLDRPSHRYTPDMWAHDWSSWAIWPVRAIFDETRSGAGITWDFFHPNLPRPKLVDYVEDRDLWRFALPHSREINAFIFSHEYSFQNWDRIDHKIATDFDGAVAEGAAIERKHHKDIAELVRVTKRRMVIGGVEVWCANLPYTLTSDAGNLMAHGAPFAACYWDTPEGRVFSLRSLPDGADVSEIAKQYGGGGHKNASGFRLPHGVDP